MIASYSVESGRRVGLSLARCVPVAGSGVQLFGTV